MNQSNKLVALGDSILKGVLFNQDLDGRMHYSLSERGIVDRVADVMHFDAINLGKMGCTITIGERIVDRNIGKLVGAKYALMCYGGNDSDYDWLSIANDPSATHHPRTALDEFEKTYERLVNKVRNIGLTPIILSLPPMNPQVYFDFFSANFTQQQKNNVLSWLKGSVDTIFAGHELYNEAVRRVAKATDCLLVDITHALGDGSGLLCQDGIHPNCEGQYQIANIIIKNT